MRGIKKKKGNLIVVIDFYHSYLHWSSCNPRNENKVEFQIE